MIISEENKSFLWLQSRTGSNHAVQIFSKFGFKTRKTTENGYIFLELKPVHNMSYFSGHEKYTFICTARNPFTRLLSSYKFNNKTVDWNPKNFQDFFYHRFKLQSLGKFIYPFMNRTPDYFIRLENLYEDYQKLDFIKNSELNESGDLSILCKRKINDTEDLKNPEGYFTNEIIEMVYEEGAKFFDLTGYNYPF